MRTVSMSQLEKEPTSCLDMAQGDQVVITRNGRPAAVVIGVEGQDWESIQLGLDSSFWELIHKRRAQPTISWDDMVEQLDKE
ncbi:MAG: hypothetical protein COZ56_20095 [Armatimonadetes bacterium CG_4_8_14_3_um_filter_58_9]|nr:MAG: hypothetical protein COZ56_20095 [Armatimonadetes bacterium CG_4_8_14_3_um_filter_58_9]PJB62945.1 MAG: hypothetical protein CO095_17545 [Armatimonadetes bacterium CG_4_9_14_3_um_filter_58_7]